MSVLKKTIPEKKYKKNEIISLKSRKSQEKHYDQEILQLLMLYTFPSFTKGKNLKIYFQNLEMIPKMKGISKRQKPCKFAIIKCPVSSQPCASILWKSAKIFSSNMQYLKECLFSFLFSKNIYKKQRKDGLQKKNV